MWIVDCGLWIVDCGLWIVDCNILSLKITLKQTASLKSPQNV
ncbi:hypothetical protein HBZS_124230 [Helicobacter bizzozeronii CCUG 35545]|nr:hypothetical protein HBZS_124230 [Helicobacter bizzozeronii CCUG 35545]